MSLSDEELMSMTDEEIVAYANKHSQSEPTAQPEPVTTTGEEPVVTEQEEGTPSTAVAQEPEEQEETPENKLPEDEEDDETPDTSDSDNAAAETNTPASTEPVVEGEPENNAGESTPTTAQESEEAIRHREFYELLNRPFKANGREVQIRSPEEAIRLMQQGIGFNKHMQDLAPKRKLLMLLERHKINSEEDMGFLLDLHNRNPDAIRKLVQESGIDPMEIDTENPVEYQQGNHQVSNEEVAFYTAVEELKTTASGMQALQTFDRWDQASASALYNQPQLMSVIQGHIESGVYAQVESEIERLRMLGQIGPSVPFIQAYDYIGTQLGLFQAAPSNQPASPEVTPTVAPVQVQPVSVAPTAQPVRTPVAVQAAAASNPVVKDGASAAATPRKAPNPTGKNITARQIMNMSDEEIEKLDPSKVM